MHTPHMHYHRARTHKQCVLAWLNPQWLPPVTLAMNLQLLPKAPYLARQQWPPHIHGGQFDFVWLAARAMGLTPLQRNHEKYPHPAFFFGLILRPNTQQRRVGRLLQDSSASSGEWRSTVPKDGVSAAKLTSPKSNAPAALNRNRNRNRSRAAVLQRQLATGL